jgi:hypothetical protein
MAVAKTSQGEKIRNLENSENPENNKYIIIFYNYIMSSERSNRPVEPIGYGIPQNVRTNPITIVKNVLENNIRYITIFNAMRQARIMIFGNSFEVASNIIANAVRDFDSVDDDRVLWYARYILNIAEESRLEMENADNTINYLRISIEQFSNDLDRRRNSAYGGRKNKSRRKNKKARKSRKSRK